jgi:4-carboxymuconolactone decarboxylase
MSIAMSRFSEPRVSEMNERQREVAAEIASGPRGHATGLMGLWLHSPELASRMQKVGEFLRFRGSLPERDREMCILLIAREWRCYHEWIIHEPIARSNGLAPEIINAIRDLRRPKFPESQGEAIYDYVYQMLREHSVSQRAFDKVRGEFGPHGVIELAALIGHYIIGAATLNAAEFDLPAGVEAPFS